MTSNVELLPLPAEIRARDFKWAAVEVYTRANVIHHTAPLRYALDNAARSIKSLRGVMDSHAAEIVALRAEVRTLVRQNGEWQARVKPAEPRRIWVNTYGNRMGFAYASREQADANADAGIYRVECVEFVEVVK